MDILVASSGDAHHGGQCHFGDGVGSGRCAWGAWQQWIRFGDQPVDTVGAGLVRRVCETHLHLAGAHSEYGFFGCAYTLRVQSSAVCGSRL